jgi:hypothetical protein
MASGALDGERQFVEVGWGFLGILLGSRVLSWMVPGTVVGDNPALLGFTCLVSLPTWSQYGWASLPPAPSYGLQPSD